MKEASCENGHFLSFQLYEEKQEMMTVYSLSFISLNTSLSSNGFEVHHKYNIKLSVYIYWCLQSPGAVRAVFLASDHPYSHAHA